MDSNEKNQDIAGKKYWDNTERNQQVVMQPFSPNGNRIGDFGKRIWHKAFHTTLAEFAGTGKKLLELGCGGSAYLPYFFRQFGLQVYGMDYSERGCELARQMCEVNGVPSQIICSDFFEPPPEMLAAFDVVVSFGVVEHFTDTQSSLSRFANFLRPGGLMITTVPNMWGLAGLAQSVLARDVFDKCRPQAGFLSKSSRGCRLIDCAMRVPLIHWLRDRRHRRQSSTPKEALSRRAEKSKCSSLGLRDNHWTFAPKPGVISVLDLRCDKAGTLNAGIR